MSGTVYLVPTTLGGDRIEAVIPDAVRARIRELHHFVAENPKSARAFLKLAGTPRRLAEIQIERLDHNSAKEEIDALLAPVLAGQDIGIVSEAGCPAIADPGALLVRRAHERGIRVVPLTGPSSVLLALIASGLESQRFAFHGYLPVRSPERERRIRDIESRSRKNAETQIFIETPYRNDRLLDALLCACRPETLLCVATSLTLPEESVRTRAIASWKDQKPVLADRPSIFLLLADPDR